MKGRLLHYFWFATILVLPAFNGFCQTDIMEGGHVVIASGATLTSMVTIKVRSGGRLANYGMVQVRKDLNNYNTSPDFMGPGTFLFLGISNQIVEGQNIFQNLTLNNPTGLTISGNTKILGSLWLLNGQMVLGNFNLQLGPAALVTGMFSSTSMVVSTGMGEFRKEFASPGSFLFPVGNGGGSSQYSPVTLTFYSGTFPSGNYTGVSLVNEKYPDANISENYINRYWNITQSGLEDFICDAVFQYASADVVGEESELSCTKVNPPPWVTYSPANVQTNELIATGITSFAPYAGGFLYSSFTGVGNAFLPVSQQVGNVNIGPGKDTCYAASQVIIVAGNGTFFHVESGGNVTLNAGQMILFQPGTMVYQGGYMYGKISTNGNYCGTTMKPIVSTIAGEGEQTTVTLPSRYQFLRIYPNPTANVVIVEFLQIDPGANLKIEIYNMTGQEIASKSNHGEIKQQFSLAGLPKGIYMVRARSGNRSQYAKIVKN